VSVTCLRTLARLLEPLEAVLADCFEHEQATVADGSEEARVHESPQHVEVRLPDFLGSLEREAAGENREPCEERFAPSSRRS
jgi:hypothetical protein